MSTALLIARREFNSYFRSWLGPVLVAGVLLADGCFSTGSTVWTRSS